MFKKALRTLIKPLKNFSRLLSQLPRRRSASQGAEGPMGVVVNQRVSVFYDNEPGRAVSTNVAAGVRGPQPAPQRRPTAIDERLGRTAVVSDLPRTREGSGPRVQIASTPAPSNTPGRSR